MTHNFVKKISVEVKQMDRPPAINVIGWDLEITVLYGTASRYLPKEFVWFKSRISFIEVHYSLHTILIIANMKFVSTLAIALVASSEAFATVPPNSSPSSTALRAEMGETGVAFENVAREWRCKVCHVILR